MHDNSPAPRRARSSTAIAFYNFCRQWHGYLSALAFLALIFFSASGILLNHPEWLSDTAPEGRSVAARIAASDLRQARQSADAGAALGNLAARQLPLLGSYASADIDNRQAFLRFEGVKGSSDVTIDLASGAVSGHVHPADALTMMDDLHRGKNVGKAWQWFIDIAGVVILAMSVLGYALFFMLRFRLRTGLALTLGSLLAMAGVFVLLVH